MSRSPLIADDQQLDLCEWLETAGATHDHEAKIRQPTPAPRRRACRRPTTVCSMRVRRLHAEAAHD